MTPARLLIAVAAFVASAQLAWAQVPLDSYSVSVELTREQALGKGEPPGVLLIRDRCGGPRLLARSDAGVEIWEHHGWATPEGLHDLAGTGFFSQP